MTNDQFQRERAIEARSWMNSLEYKRLAIIQGTFLQVSIEI